MEAEQQEQQKIARRDYIAAVMAKQGIHKNPRKYIVLRQWNEIVDHDSTYEVKVPPVPGYMEPGTELYAIIRPDSPALGKVKVVEDRRLVGVFIEPVEMKVRVQFLVPREDCRMLPIPLRPHAILRADLKLYIGDEAAEIWHEHRRHRREQRPAQE